MVIPAYRLNVFGFLASNDLQADSGHAGNFGFWDQREALGWTVKYISHFGGNKDLITLGGFSAGGYSAYHQLAYDLLVSKNKRPCIKRLFVQSNGPGTQPRFVDSAQEQFDELLRVLNIPAHLPSEDKMAILRTKPAEELINAGAKLKLHEFRAVSDDKFVTKSLFNQIDSGGFAGLLRKHNIEMLLSEVKDERTTYAKWRPPKSDALDNIRTRLRADYPEAIVDAIVDHYSETVNSKPGRTAGGLDFGKIHSGVQVHLTLQGFADKLATHGAGHLVRRVRTEWLSSTAKRWTPKCMGVTHGTDSPIWFWGNGEKLQDKEKSIIREFVADVFWKFVSGEDVQSTARGWWKKLEGKPEYVRTLKEDGLVVNERSPLWEDGQRFWEAVRDAAWVEER